MQLNKPLVYASIDQFKGQCSVFNANNGPCYRCLYPQAPQQCVMDCATAGVLGVLPGLLGVMQATEVIKLIVGIGEPLIGRVLMVDALSMRFKTFELMPNIDCACRHYSNSDAPSAPDPISDHANKHEISKHTNASIDAVTDILVDPINEISPQELQQLQHNNDDIFLLDVRTDAERAQYDIGGHFIPLAQLPSRLAELPKNQHIVVYCSAGKRSIKAARLLLAAGFTEVASLQGGILAWHSFFQTTV